MCARANVGVGSANFCHTHAQIFSPTTKRLYLWQNLMATKLKEVYPDITYTQCWAVHDCTEQYKVTGMSGSMEHECTYASMHEEVVLPQLSTAPRPRPTLVCT